MVDEIRKGDWCPAQCIATPGESPVLSNMWKITGREAQDAEVAEELGIGLDEYHASPADANSGDLSLDELNESGELPIEEAEASDNPLDGIVSGAFQRSLADAIEQLPEREKLVLSLYYQEELNLKEICAVLGVMSR